MEPTRVRTLHVKWVTRKESKRILEGKGLLWLTSSMIYNSKLISLVPHFKAMPKVPRRLAATPVPTLRQQYLTVINSSTHRIFSLDPDTLSLTEYYWYVAILIHPIIGELLFVQARRRREACDTGCAAQLSQGPRILRTLLLMPTLRYRKRDWAPVRWSCHIHTAFWALRGGVCRWMHKEPMRLSRFVLSMIEGKYWY